jgi:hypothetical protein
MDLLKSHFPGMVGASKSPSISLSPRSLANLRCAFTVFVLKYGWMYAGMWQLAKRVLPNTALERILFPSTEELLEFFEEDHLLTGELLLWSRLCLSLLIVVSRPHRATSPSEGEREKPSNER